MMSKAIPFLLASLAALTALVGVSAAQAQDPAAGEKKAAMCIGCHSIVGYQASFPEVHKVPMIAGQGAKYIVASLTAYKKGERKHPTMRGIAGSKNALQDERRDKREHVQQHGEISEGAQA